MPQQALSPVKEDHGWGMFRALRSRNYRLFFIGQMISLIGTFLTQIATVWLVYRLTKNPLWLGTVAFAGQIPLFFLAPFGGVWVDRWNKRRLLVITQILSGLQSLALALLTLFQFAPRGNALPSSAGYEIWEIIGLAFIQGLINCFDMPGRQAFTVEMVDDREDLANAIALNSTMVHTARSFGPAAAGFLVYYFGEGYCFLIDSVSYIAVVVSLLLMRVAQAPPRARDRSVVAELKEGIDYVWTSVPIRVLLLLMAILSLTAMPAFNILMPVFADALAPTPDHGSQILGFLQGASGLGALAGAIYLAARRTVVGLGRLIAIAGLVFGCSIIAFSSSRHLWLSLLFTPVAGFGMITVFASANTLLQTLADDDKRGRVMALFTVAFMGMAPFGNLLSGAAAAHFGGGIGGAARTVATGGIVAIVAVAFFAAMLPAMRKIIRPIYVQKGILTEVATGLEAAEPENP